MHITPPHHPTFNVRLDEQVLRSIVEFVFPGRTLRDASPLASGRSFNNRIYFLCLEPEPTNLQDQYVLKVSGQFFGARKVQNEVGALTLLRRFCSCVPIPELVAWSETGTTIHTVDGRHCEDAQAATSKQGWVLMSRLPGRVLELTDLDDSSGAAILTQLARHMVNWRKSLPLPQRIGHIRFQELTDLEDADCFNGPSATSPLLTLGGLILCHTYSLSPLASALAYFEYQLRDQYNHLVSAAELSQLASKISSPIEELLDALPNMSLFQGNMFGRSSQDTGNDSKQGHISAIAFSHMDFSPRNILVEPSSDGQTLEVSGILDFEFAAFLPCSEEFVNAIIHQPDDWPSKHYDTLLSHIRQFGEDIPDVNGSGATQKHGSRPRVFEARNFKKLGLLEKIIGGLAPWWITPQWHKQHSASEVSAEIEAAANTVLKAIIELNAMEFEDCDMVSSR